MKNDHARARSPRPSAEPGLPTASRAPGRQLLPTVLLSTLALLPTGFALIALLFADLRPPGLYSKLGGDAPLLVHRDHTIEVGLTMTAQPTGIVLPLRFDSADQQIGLAILEGDTSEVLWQSVVRPRGVHQSTVRLAPVAMPSRTWPSRVRLRISSPNGSNSAPAVYWSDEPPRRRINVTLGGTNVETRGPILLVEYEWPSRGLLWSWLLVPPLVFLAIRQTRWLAALVVALTLCASATGVLVWQRDYTRHGAHWDADGFGRYAGQIAALATEPDISRYTNRFFERYPHLHTPLVPAMVAGISVLGVPVPQAYVAVSGICTFGALWALVHLLYVRLAVSPRSTAIATMLVACHLIFIRSAGRPVTDACGLFLVTLLLDLSLRLWSDRRAIVAIAVVGLLNALARPQGLGYLGFTGGVTLASAIGRWPTPGELRPAASALAVTVGAPLAAWLGLAGLFGWWGSIRSLTDLVGHFGTWNTTADFAASIAATVQLLPIVWFIGRRSLRRVDVGILAAWAGFYVGLLIMTQAPFWLRHFEPLLPPVAAMTALALDGTSGTSRRTSTLIVVVLAAANVLAVAYWVSTPTELGMTTGWLPVFG